MPGPGAARAHAPSPATFHAVEFKGSQRHRVPQLLEGQGVRAVSDEALVPAADVYGVQTFFSSLGGKSRTGVCDGPACRVCGSEELTASLDGPAEGVICLGRCDHAVEPAP